MNTRAIVLVLVLLAIAGGIGYFEARKVSPVTSGEGRVALNLLSAAEKASKYPPAQELVNPDGFLNAEPFTLKDLIGKKVILIDFWTYSCINCIRTLPYLNAWYEKYKDAGLEIVGVHTPEFEFEKERANVAAAIEKYGIRYPVVQDNAYATWSAYKNQYWPRKYLIDIDGYIIYDHIGEGSYDETEKMIQKALEERKARLGDTVAIAADMAEPENAESVDFTTPKSPETYFGSARNEFFGSGSPGVAGAQTFSVPFTVRESTLYLSGPWAITPEYAESKGVGKIVYRYGGNKMFLVASSEKPLRVRVLRDGKPLPAGVRGEDVDADSYVTIHADQLYRLVEDPEWGVHTIEIEVEGAGLRAFAFTFG